jgi:hypothetical protein
MPQPPIPAPLRELGPGHQHRLDPLRIARFLAKDVDEWRGLGPL